MTTDLVAKVALLFRGNREMRTNVTAANNRLSHIFEAFATLNVAAEPAVYSDEMVDEVRSQLRGVDGVVVWVNPIQDGEDRTKLDAMLREVSSEGVWVSAHPDVILKMGTKEVLYYTRDLGWGTDTYLYNTVQEFKDQFPQRLAAYGPRVLKQHRGNGGEGTWKVELMAGSVDSVIVDHARTHRAEERMLLAEFMDRCDGYFIGSGCMVDQPFQTRLAEGAIRVYLTHAEVVGFAHQMPRGFLPARELHEDANVPGPTARASEDLLTAKMESDWVPAMQKLLDIDATSLPVIWDADFLYGPKTENGEDTFVLSEINVSAVYPFPEEAVGKVVQAAVACVLSAKTSRV